jgi:hypothetical protein
MIHIELKGLNRLKRDVELFSKRAVPHAVRETLNGCAFALQKEWRGEVRQSFTLRNKYTERSIQVDRARGIDTRAMQARTGSIAHYMDEQEEGAIVRGGGKHKPIPGPAAAGQAPGGKRTRTVRQGLRLSAITVSHSPLARYGKRRQNAIALAIARRKGERFALLNRSKGGGRGLFEVRGGRRTLRTRLLYDVSRGSVRVPAEPTLQRSIRKSQRAFEQAQYLAVLRQLKRHKVFGY